MAQDLNPTTLGNSAPPWLVTPEKVDAAVQRIVEACDPHAVILFGSYARGDVTADSDLDVLVVADDSVENCRRESVRLRRCLRGILMPVDIIVARHKDFERVKDEPGLIYQSFQREGKVAYERG
jgi:predicted nucleotidyltransferase